MTKFATYEQFIEMVSKSKDYDRSPNPKVIDIMDPTKPVKVSSSSKLDPKKVRAIFLLPVQNLEDPMPIHMDVSKEDFENMKSM